MTQLQIPGRVEMLRVLQAFVVENAKIYRLPKSLLEHLKLVSEEAFLHVLKNSFQPDDISDIKISVEVDHLHFRLSFFDKGLPFDSSLIKEYHPGNDVNTLNTEGMELFLIKQFADRVEWINHGTEGKEFRLSFELPQKDIITLLEGKKEKKEEPVASLKDIEIRTFQDGDAIKISRAIYQAYGYTYPNENMYYPEKIAAQNKNGTLISVVCYDKKRQEVAGHYALERPLLGPVAESGQAVVSPAYRGFHLMAKMRTLLEKKAHGLQLEGIMSQPVTTHVFSQKVNEGFGSKPCGFSFGLVPQKMSFRKINDSLSQRESCMLYFKSLKKRNRTVYIPEKHRTVVEKIYRNLELPFRYGEPEKPAPKTKGTVQYNYYSGWGYGVIEVKQPGENSYYEIKQALFNLLFTLKADVIFLYIPLEDADITHLVKAIEKERFFFAGITPSFLDGRDVIRFEYLNGFIDSSKIKIYSQQANEIFQYILQQKEKTLQ